MGPFACAVAASLLASASVLPAYGQSPLALPGTTPPGTVAKAAAADDGAAAARALAEAKEALARVDRQLATREDLPPQIDDARLGERQTLLHRTVRTYEQRAMFAAELADLQTRHAELDARRKAWTPGTPPYSLAIVDGYRTEVAQARDRMEAAQAKTALLVRQAEGARDLAVKLETAARQAAERAEPPGDDRSVRMWDRDTARERVRNTAALLALLEVAARLAEEQERTARDELAFAQERLARTADHVAFTQSDLERVRDALARERAAIEREVADAEALEAARRRVRAAAEADLAAVRAAAGAPDAAKIAALERTLELRRIEEQSAAVTSDLLRSLGDLTRFELGAWDVRFQLATAPDPEHRRAAYAKLGQLAAEAGPWRSYIGRELEVVRGRIDEAEAQASLATAPNAVANARARVAAWREREAILVRVGAAVAREARTLGLWQDEFKARLGTRTVGERAADAWAAAAQAVRTAWNFELFSADDSVEIDGRKVTVTRSVTVGKSVGAVALLMLGYVLSAWLLRRGERTLVQRFNADSSAARIARRWLQVLVVAALFVLALDLVKIPLTVFAFLGGALAIGVGFGAQTLIKNFMSGLLLLVERPLKLGDIVEIGGVVGTVTNISIRACTIRTGEGIETLVPNSTFVESNVTNWTLSNPRVRRSVKVAVAYGSDTRQVTDLLRGVAERHGQVLSDPAPRVIFEDFGADGLAFALEYWIDFSQGVDGRQIGSDLRLMIARTLAEAGIEIPFPQRDLHLAGGAPLRVEVVPRDAAAGLRAAQG